MKSKNFKNWGKKGINLFHFVGGFLVFSLVILTGVLVINDVSNNYPTANVSNDSFSDIFNTINDTLEITQSIKNDTLNSNIEETSAIQTMTLGSFKALKQVTAMFGIIIDIFSAINQEVPGIPEFVIPIAVGLITLAVIFTIIYLVMGLGRE